MPRKEKKYHFIYKTINVLTKRYYYGMHSTDNLEDGYLGSGKRLRYSIRKYGKENHIREIIEFCNSRKELEQKEEKLVNLNEIAKKDCMNIKIGGEGGGINHGKNFGGREGRIKGAILANKIRTEKILNDEKFNEFFRQRISEGRKEYCRKNGNGWSGRKHKPETIEKMKKSKNVGKENSQYGTMWITNGIENKKIKKDEKIPKGFVKGRK